MKGMEEINQAKSQLPIGTGLLRVPGAQPRARVPAVSWSLGVVHGTASLLPRCLHLHLRSGHVYNHLVLFLRCFEEEVRWKT